MNRRAVLFVAFGILFLTAMICARIAWFGSQTSIVNISTPRDYDIRIWSEIPGLRDLDPDVADPSIYYEIDKLGSVVVPKTYLGLNFNYEFQIQVAYAEDGTLVCVYDAQHWDRGVFVLFDSESNESWPRVRDDEVSYDSTVVQKWIERYSRLKQENPGLPTYQWLIGVVP